MIIQILIMLVGFLLLWKGGEFLVDGANDLALRFGLSPFFVGLTVVAFGTSAPELCVSLLAAIQGKSDIIFGNVLGSNITNLLSVLGISGMITPLMIQRRHLMKCLPLSIMLYVLLMVMIYIPIGESSFTLGQWGAFILFAGFIGMLFMCMESGKAIKQDATQVEPLMKSLSWVICGIVTLPLGAKWVVEPAIVIASELGVTEVLISVVAVAVGTSLPEGVTAVIAALKKKSGMVIGSVIGSNMFNAGLILGTVGMIKPLSFNPVLWTEMRILIFSTLAVIFMAYLPKRYQLSSTHSAILCVGYVGYLIYVVVRG